jgi:hypothetical protein
MKFRIKPGEVVILLLKNHDRPDSHAFPCMTTVMQVKKGALAVSEAESKNGLAYVMIVGDTHDTGRYWYEYKDLNGKGTSLDVVAMNYADGSPIRKGSDFTTES